MVTSAITSPSITINEATWSELYASLRSIARSAVYSLRVSSWYGQEEDIVEDIIQETARRLSFSAFAKLNAEKLSRSIL